MTDNALFYRRQAETERLNAAEAVLSNVRERCERAAIASQELAARAERTDTLRRQREAGARPATGEIADVVILD